jgi:outer membrane biosynthesis protein TonB
MQSSSGRAAKFASFATQFATLACIAVLGGCASSRQSEPPPATAATEPEHTPVIEKSRTMPFTRESPPPQPEQNPTSQAATVSPTPEVLPTLQPVPSEKATPKRKPAPDARTPQPREVGE